MTDRVYYCTVDQARKLIGLTATDISDADVKSFLDLAESEIDEITNTIHLVAQDSGTATSGDATTVTDSAGGWEADEWNTDDNFVGGYMVYIYAGTNSGECRVITDNSTTALTVSPAFTAAIDDTSKYRIFKNTYQDETFDGNDTDIYFVNNYPLFNLYSITIDSTDVTISNVFQYPKLGKIQLDTNAEKNTWIKATPQLCNIKYFSGTYPIKNLISSLCAIIGAIMIGEYMMGSTYTFATSYSLPELTVNKGVPYPHFAKVLDSLNKRYDQYRERIMAMFNPAFG